MELVRTIAMVISTCTVVIGAVFALIQLRHLRATRKREAMLELVHRLQTPEFARAMRTVFELRNSHPKGRVEEVVQQDPGLMYELMATWESLGILVFRGELSLETVDDFFSGPIVISWEVLGNFVIEERRNLQRETTWEWFQWLAERMEERENEKPPVPAYIAYYG